MISKIDNYLKIVLAIFYTVGVIGMWFNPFQFILLTPYNLLLTSGILVFSYRLNEQPQLMRLMVLIFAAGFAIELIGVHTGKIFGHYYYGYALGFKLKQIPLIIGLNWVMLTLSAHSVAYKFFKGGFKTVLFAALLMVALDIFIEQVADKYELWHWQNDHIPLQNYFAWFIFSLLFQQVTRMMLVEKHNTVASFIFVLQLGFFALLNALNIFI